MANVSALHDRPIDVYPNLQVQDDTAMEQVHLIGQGFPQRAQQRKFDPYAPTYNEGTRFHPNFR